MDQEAIVEVRLTREQLKQEYLYLSAAQIKDRQVALREAMKAKYKRSYGMPLYGALPRDFTHSQLIAFFTELYRFRNHDVYTAFCLQFFYGLRIGEINDAEIIPGQKIIRIRNHKAGRCDYLPLIDGTEHLFRKLNNGKGYAPAYLRKYFRDTCYRLGDDFLWTYEHATDGRPLRQFTTHSMRHTAGNMLHHFTGNVYKAQVFLRHNTHSRYGATAHYMHYRIEDMREDLNRCFGPLVPLLTCVASRQRKSRGQQ